MKAGGEGSMDKSSLEGSLKHANRGGHWEEHKGVQEGGLLAARAQENMRRPCK